MAPPILYSTELSPPCRSVLLTVAAARINIDIQETSLLNGDHRKEEFVKINPQHTIPTLNDNGFILSDSHAIVTYLVDKYAKDDSLYPKDLEKRALINQFLHFDTAVLFANVKGLCYPILFKGATQTSQDRIDLLTAGCGILEKFIGDNDWLVGDSYTLADISVVATVSGLPVFLPLDKFPKINAWIKRCEDHITGYATANEPGNTLYMNTIRERMLNP